MDILIVEDNRHMRRMLKQLALEAWPAASVGTAATAGDAWALLTATPPRAVLMDIDLPDQNGLDLTARIRRLLPGAAVVIVSNHGAAVYRAHAASLAVHGFVQKDDVDAELLPLLRTLFQADPPTNGSPL